MYSRDWLVDNVYKTTRSKPKVDVILLKIDSDDICLSDASVNGITFMFLMDSGVSKRVMSSKWFMSIPDFFRPNICNTRMKFQVANEEVMDAML